MCNVQLYLKTNKRSQCIQVQYNNMWHFRCNVQCAMCNNIAVKAEPHYAQRARLGNAYTMKHIERKLRSPQPRMRVIRLTWTDVILSYGPPLRSALLVYSCGCRMGIYIPHRSLLLSQRPSAGRHRSAMGKPGWNRGKGARPVAPRLHGKGCPPLAPAAEQTSALARYLVQQCMWGLMSPQQVQEIASLAESDIQNFGPSEGTSWELARLAHIGAMGTRPQNCWRDLTRTVSPSSLPVGKTLTLPTQTPTPGVYKDLKFDILLPHEFVSALYANYAGHFRDHACPGRESCLAFWRDMADHPCMEGHPMKAFDGWQSCTVPICVFSDGVPVKGVGKSWGESMNIISWSSCLAGHGNTLQTNHLVFSMWKQLISKTVGHVTMSRVWREVAWSLEAMYHGKLPRHDLDGRELYRGPLKDLAGGFRFVLFGIKADLEALSTDALFLGRF